MESRALVVYNSRLPESLAVASDYLAKRNIPAANLCAIAAPFDVGYVDYPAYVATIRTPIQNALGRLGPSTIQFIVCCFGVPFVVYDQTAFPGSNARAVDSLLAMPFLANDKNQYTNPYQAGDQSGANLYAPFVSLAEFRRTHPSYPLVYCVGRLDGATAAIATAQLDQALAAEANGLHGQGLFDARYDVPQPFADAGYGSGDWDILRAWQMWTASGRPAIADRHEGEFGSGDVPMVRQPTAFYWGWYQGWHLDAFDFQPGCIGVHIDSSSATNIRGTDNFVGAVVNLKGITAASGAVAEPYLNGLPHGDTVLRSLLSGATLGEALARGQEQYCWMTTNVGDPLYTPFPNSTPPVIPMQLPATPPLPPVAPNGSATAAFIQVNTVAPSGAEGALKPTDVSMASSPFTIRAGDVWTWTANASCWYGPAVKIDVRTPTSGPHQVGVYLLDFDHAGRAVMVEILDSGGAVLDSRSVTDFSSGQWLIYSVTGTPTIRVTRTAGVNAVVSAIALDAVVSTSSDTLASLVPQIQVLVSRLAALVPR